MMVPMTVGALIDALNNYDPNLNVIIEGFSLGEEYKGRKMLPLSVEQLIVSADSKSTIVIVAQITAESESGVTLGGKE